MTVYGSEAARDRHGWFLGLTGAQVFLVLAAAFPAWLAMAVGQWWALLGLVPAWGLAVLLVCLPIRGWSAAQWLGVATRHLVGQAAGWTRFHANAAAGEAEDLTEADLPGVLAGIRIHDGPPLAGRRPAIIQNHATRTWAATARVAHPGIGMSAEDERFQMGSGMAELFEAASAGHQIDLVAIQVRSIPDDGTDRAAWVRRHARLDGEPELSARIHAADDAAMTAASVRTEAFVTVVVREETIGKDARRAGRGVAGRARALYSLLVEVEARLTGAIGCTQVSWLDSGELAVAIRSGFEPGDAAALADAAIHAQSHPGLATGVPVAAAGPTTTATAMRSYRHGDWVSVTATILLPRKGAVMGALARALVPSAIGERRALTVFYRPIAQQAAQRRTGRDQINASMGAEARRKLGRAETAKDRRAAQQVNETDEKLARGRSLVKLSAALSVTIPGYWDAHDFGRRLDASVRLCGLTPLPLDGAHDAAFAAATIPLGTGLPLGRKK